MTIFLLLSLVLVLSTKSMAAAPMESTAAAPMESTAAAPTESTAATRTVFYDDRWYDELRLVLQWPATYCRTGNVICNDMNIPPYFTVHGLWLNRNSCPVNCLPAHIQLSYRQIRSDLKHRYPNWETIWPNLNIQRSEVYLWGHEYEKHGHCFIRFRNPVDYFRTALDIYSFTVDQNIVTSIIQSMNSPTGFYRVEQFKHVHWAGGTLTVGLRCILAYKGAFPQLLEIVICTYPNKTLKNCSYVDTCNAQWKDGRYPRGVTGLFYIPSNIGRGSLRRLPPDSDPVPCNSRYPPHQPTIPVA